jgi:hypothetical protein
LGLGRAARVQSCGAFFLQRNVARTPTTTAVNNVIFGMGLVVLSQMVQAIQLTFEDYFMADLNMKPMQV